MRKLKIHKNLELSDVSLKILKLITKGFSIGSDTGTLYTFALYNGRERGICIVCRKNYDTSPYLIFFGECRSSDYIFVWDSLSDNYFFQPEIKNFTEESYKLRKTFEHDFEVQASEYIKKLITKYFEN